MQTSISCLRGQLFFVPLVNGAASVRNQGALQSAPPRQNSIHSLGSTQTAQGTVKLVRNSLATSTTMGNRFTSFGARATSAQYISSLEEMKTALSVGDALVVVMFYEDNCPDCRRLGPQYEDLVVSNPTVVFLEADFSINKAAGEALNVTKLPTVILFRNHLELARLVNPDMAELERLITANL